MKIILALGVMILLAACNNQKTSGNGETSTAGSNTVITRTDTIYLERNSNISPANAYSDLFLDSNTISHYEQGEGMNGDKLQAYNSFYNYRNGQFAWFSSEGFTEQARGFWNLQDKMGYKVSKSLRNAMDTLLENDSLLISRYDTAIRNTEMALTNAFLDFYKTDRARTNFAGLAAEQAIPVKKMKTFELADSLLRRQPDTGLTSTSDYGRLLQKLKRYITVTNDGGGLPLKVNARSLKKGGSSAGITSLKKMLHRTGDYAGTDTSAVFNDSLMTAIKVYQQANGMAPTGLITDSLVGSVNMPLEKRIQQIIINLYRTQWMPVSQEPNYIAVNIPDFRLTIFENNTKAFDMPVAVGKEGANTTVFTGMLNQVVFSPYWNIPASIVQREILPKLKADPKYLQSKNMEIVGKNDSLPKIRQKPGKDNALGKVKFLFPNRYDIYFHDTYNKEIFNKANRALSHGCIRLQDAEKLAVYILRNDKNWTAEKVQMAMNAGKEQYVKVSPPMPVQIAYYTAWVDADGQLNFRNDIYGNDIRAGQMLFEISQAMTLPGKTDSLQVKKDTGLNRPLLKKSKK
ncbi:MAG: L,D-transpeptidase family protein [Ferruginibacter sp.]